MGLPLKLAMVNEFSPMCCIQWSTQHLHVLTVIVAGT